jgi:protein phosphatase
MSVSACSDIGQKCFINTDTPGDLVFPGGLLHDTSKLEIKGHLFAIADGIGSEAQGKFASHLAINSLFEKYYGQQSGEDLLSELQNAVQYANTQLYLINATANEKSGAELVLVLVEGNQAIFANIGRCRGYLIHQGLVEQITHDHSLVQELIDAGKMTQKEARKSSIRNFLTCVLGGEETITPSWYRLQIVKGDTLLLCTDGLHNMVEDGEMASILRNNPDLDTAARLLIDLANERGRLDNISVMLVRIDGFE